MERRPQGGGIWHERAYLYDAAGRVTRRTDGVVGQTLGQIVAEYEYDDPEGLLTAVEYPATPGRNASLTYDGYGPSPDGTENY